MTEKLRNFKPFFSFFAAFFYLILYRCLTHLIITCPLFCEIFIALIAKEPYSALCFLVLIKNSFNFYRFFLFLNAFLFLNFLWHLWRFRVHNSCSCCLEINTGNFGFESFFVEKYDKNLWIWI